MRKIAFSYQDPRGWGADFVITHHIAQIMTETPDQSPFILFLELSFLKFGVLSLNPI